MWRPLYALYSGGPAPHQAPQASREGAAEPRTEPRAGIRSCTTPEKAAPAPPSSASRLASSRFPTWLMNEGWGQASVTS